jgi:hypothetical protein
MPVGFSGALKRHRSAAKPVRDGTNAQKWYIVHGPNTPIFIFFAYYIKKNTHKCAVFENKFLYFHSVLGKKF